MIWSLNVYENLYGKEYNFQHIQVVYLILMSEFKQGCCCCVKKYEFLGIKKISTVFPQFNYKRFDRVYLWIIYPQVSEISGHQSLLLIYCFQSLPISCHFYQKHTSHDQFQNSSNHVLSCNILEIK